MRNLQMNNKGKVNPLSEFLNPSRLAIHFFLFRLLNTLWLKESINIKILYGIN